MTAPLAPDVCSEALFLPTMMTIRNVRSLTTQEKLFQIETPTAEPLGHTSGQFVQVSVLGIGEAPISISSSPSRSTSTFELCIRCVGSVTNALHGLRGGDEIGIRGPFGHGFPVDLFRGHDMLFIPGGLGLAPLRSLINEVLDHREQFNRVIVLYGARRPAELLFRDELDEWQAREDIELQLTVDHAEDDWRGNVGVITTLIPGIRLHPRNTIAVTCGPPVMYRFVLMELLGKGLPEWNIWLSLERRMKCGVGKCGHCQLDHLYTCQDGPAFSYAKIKYLKEAF